MMDSLRLFLTYVRLNVVNELQYRVNFWTNLLELSLIHISEPTRPY